MKDLFTEQPKDPKRRAFMAAGAMGSAALVGTTLAGQAVAQTIAAESVDPLGGATDSLDITALPRVQQKMVSPPHAPEHEQVATGGPKIVEVEMTIIEKKVEIDHDGTSIWAFTYEGTVPGPLIICHQGDYIELTLKSHPDNQLEHNIDFHAATGALGGAALTFVQPGEKVVMRFRAIKAGTFTYHCAPGGVMIPYHVVHGMNGAVMVLPREGLKDKDGAPIRYDSIYYIGDCILDKPSVISYL